MLASHAMKHMEGVNRVAIAQGRQMEELSNELYRLQQLCGGSQEQSGAAGGAGDAATEVAFLSEYDGVAMARWGLKDQVLFMHFQWRADYWGALPVTAGMSETELFGTAFSGGGAHCNEARRDEARAWGQQQDVELSHRLHVSVQAWLRPCGLAPAWQCGSTRAACGARAGCVRPCATCLRAAPVRGTACP